MSIWKDSHGSPRWLWLLTPIALLIGGAVFSWIGVRRLQEIHTRAAVREPALPVPEGPQKVAFILNPSKNQANIARHRMLELIAKAGWPAPLILETTVENPGKTQAQEAVEWGAQLVVVGGGDGTVRVAASVLKHTEVAMAVLPLGTGNLLARNLGVSVESIDQAINTAFFGQQRYIDTAQYRIERVLSGGVFSESYAGLRKDMVYDEEEEHTFLVISGIGMDAEVVGDTNDLLKKAMGWMAYSEAGLRHLPGRRKRIHFRFDDGPVQSRRVRSVLFCNCGLLPGGIDFIPTALIDDGVLDVVVISPRSLASWVEMVIKVLFKQQRQIPPLSFYRAQRVVVEVSTPEATQVDGDPTGEAQRVTVQVEPKALLVRVPQES